MTQTALNFPVMHKITALITRLNYVQVWKINPALLGRICIAEVFEHRNVTNQRLENLERNTSTLERGLATLVAQVEMLEINLGIIATTIGNRNTPGTLPSLPEVNPRGRCHAVQLRSGTTYQPPEAGDLGMRRREAEKPPGDASDEAVRRSAAYTSASRGELRLGHWRKPGDRHTSSRWPAGWTAVAKQSRTEQHRCPVSSTAAEQEA